MFKAKAKATHAVVVFEVRGSGEFPIDMLRFDSCSPMTGTDTSSMMRDEYGPLGVRVNRVVKLRRFFPVGGQFTPTADRWLSFGWEVISIDGVRVRP